MKRFAVISVLSSIIALGLVVGCSAKTTNTSVEQISVVDNNTTATLTEYGYAHFEQLPDLVKKKFPNVTLNNSQPDPTQKISLQDLVASGKTPDIIYLHDIYQLNDAQSMGATFDLTPLMNKYKFDLNKYDPSAMSYLRMASPNGQITALPWVGPHYVLMYNKAIFDKFGVSYPKDGMTWPEVIDLAKNLTRAADGVQYHGLLIDNYKIISDEYPLLAVDPKTNQAVLSSDPTWTKVLDLYKSIYDISGNYDPKITDNGTAFGKDQTVAMMATGKSWTLNGQTGSGVNWNMVSIPTLPEFPGQRPAISTEMFTVSSSSTNKDLAFKIIQYLVTDPVGVGFFATDEAIPPVYNTDQFKQVFAKNWGYLPADNPNALSVFYGKAAIWPKNVSQYENLATKIITDASTQVVQGKADTNTALRNASDQLNNAIQIAQQQK
ncbi:MAG: extracellular solute-binding protein family 1 [Bacilli bacterium]|nr:extracellular solute-binding protein family 1 [Bacilli bacterium]